MFQFKQFTIHQENTAMKVTTDGCLFGAWVAHRLSQMGGKNLRILDVGAGTGLLSLMIVQQCPDAKIDAIELDPGSLQDCRDNFRNSPWPERLNAIAGDINEFTSIEPYDIIVSNPPFYENELESLDAGRQLAHHGKGLILDNLLSIIKKQLTPGGRFYLLLPWKRNKEIKEMTGSHGLFISSWLLARQTPAHDHFRILVEGRLSDPILSEFNEIVIKNEAGDYTEEFKKLLKEYYLYL